MASRVIYYLVKNMARPRKNAQIETSNPFKALRLTSKLSQEQLAREIGVAVSTIRRWEKGQAEPTMTVNQMNGFCFAVNVRFEDLPCPLVSEVQTKFDSKQSNVFSVEENIVRPRKDAKANAVKKLRLGVKLSQEQLARDINVAVSTIRRWEKGQAEPTMTVYQMRAFCFTVNTTFDELPKSLIEKAVSQTNSFATSA
jgi:DNA-binding transcriptional regulator YiaG